MEQGNSKSYKIGGCDVCFPHSAYGTQLSFMGKLISALEKKHNALLEAPTGSGKTLSLLCSSLAWQEKEKRRVASVEGVTEFGRPELDKDSRPAEISKEDHLGSGGFLTGDAQGEMDAEVKTRAPRIYYATRTHSQIAQVVAELKRSGYKPKMAILGSKQHYCVNAHVRRQPSLEEACEDALKDGHCQYFRGTQALLGSAMKQVHDIEDLCRIGKSRKGCPYYMSRHMASDADIIFGPYNYFLDPVIRRSMGVDLEDAVIIFDEAHNIEDVCRDSGSLDISLDDLNEFIIILKRACKMNMKPDVYDPLHDVLQRIKDWMMQQDATTKRSSGSSQEKIWMGQQLLIHLQTMGLGPDRMELLWGAYLAAREYDEALIAQDRQNKGSTRRGDDAGPSQNKPVRIGAATLGVISRIVQIFRILHVECQNGGRDYRLVLTRSTRFDRGSSRRRVKQADEAVGVHIVMSLWCLNPGVIFKSIASKSHSVVLTSGTLAPLDSFTSELDTKFEISLEAPHVVNMEKQVFAGVVSTTPQGQPLVATYQHTSKASFQDSVGKIILSACEIVPDGLLVFFPSYALLDKLVARWKETGAMDEMMSLKSCVFEPRSGGSDALKQTMEEYYSGIQSGQGGLFFAVCRGKVSEGLDFSDANARGVIIVGIPFPNLKDAKVDAKKKYNDTSSKSMGLLTGGAWYEQQAFRALNQALGRCIRHNNDWGAILLVDERFKNQRHHQSLSRWIRSKLSIFDSYGQCLMSLEDFFSAKKRENPKKEKDEIVLPPPMMEGTGRKNALAMLMAGRKIPPKCQEEIACCTEDSSCLPAQKPESVDQPESEDGPEHTALQDAPISAWVRQDIEDWSNHVMSLGGCASEYAIRAAIVGLEESFAAVTMCPNKASCQDRFAWTATLKVPIPRGIQAIFAEVGDRFDEGDKRIDEKALAYGKEHGWHALDREALLSRMHDMYRHMAESWTDKENSVTQTVTNKRLSNIESEEQKKRMKQHADVSTGHMNEPPAPANMNEPPAPANNVADEIAFLQGAMDIWSDSDF